MFDKRCDYALNHLDKTAIVCQSVTGKHIRLTREDFSSEEEFFGGKNGPMTITTKFSWPVGMMTTASRLTLCGIPRLLPLRIFSLPPSWPQKKRSAGNGYWTKSGQSSPENNTAACACTTWRERRRRRSLLRKELPSNVSPSP